MFHMFHTKTKDPKKRNQFLCARGLLRVELVFCCGVLTRTIQQVVLFNNFVHHCFC